MGSTTGWQIDPQLSFDNVWSMDYFPPLSTSALNQGSSGPSILPFQIYSPPPHYRSSSYELPAQARVTQAALHSLHIVNPSYTAVDEHVGTTPRSVAAHFHHEHYSYSDGAGRDNYITCQWFRGSQPCGMVLEATVMALASHLAAVHGVHVEAKKEEAFRPSCGSSFTLDERHLDLNHQGTDRVEENVDPVTPRELREGALNQYSFINAQHENHLAVLTSNNPVNLLPQYATQPNSNFASSSELMFTCRWTDCGMICTDKVNAESTIPHLEYKHGVTSGSQAYTCLWEQCSTTQSMPKSSLVRHVKEKHALLKSTCPTCNKRFTRRGTLMNHWKRRHRPYQT